MLTLFVVLSVSQTPQHRLEMQPNLPRDVGPTFEAFTVSGAGTSGACSTTAPTGTKGEVLAFTRASVATCTKTASGGLATTGIANGDLVSLAANQARVEFDSLGRLKLFAEGSGASGFTDNLIRDAEMCNVAWTNVGTPACATDALAGPWGTTTMDSITDNDAAAFEGRTQTIADTSLTRHTVACYVKGDASTTKATLTLVGTGNAAGDCTGTSTVINQTTSTRVWCNSGAAYAAGLAAVVVAIKVGTATTDTGTLYIESCDHFVGMSPGQLPSTIPTAAAAATNALEAASFTAALPGATGSASGTHSPDWTGNAAANYGGPMVYFGGNARALQGFNNSLQSYDGTNNPVVLMSYAYDTPKHAYSTWGTAGGWVIRNVTDALQATSAFTAGTWAPTTTLCLTDCGAFHLNGLGGDYCYDPDPTRCR